MKNLWFVLVLYCIALCPTPPAAGTVEELLEHFQHGYVESSGFKIHYVTPSLGPLAVFSRGFPDL